MIGLMDDFNICHAFRRKHTGIIKDNPHQIIWWGFFVVGDDVLAYYYNQCTRVTTFIE